jgi:hypothetical protein
VSHQSLANFPKTKQVPKQRRLKCAAGRELGNDHIRHVQVAFFGRQSALLV